LALAFSDLAAVEMVSAMVPASHELKVSGIVIEDVVVGVVDVMACG
jgi:hypothetical protein